MEPIRLKTPKQILDAVPRLLGYSPVGSLVAIPLNGKLGGVVLRFDLPTSSDDAPSKPVSYANAVVGHLAHLNRIERVVFVLSPDLPFGPGPRPPLSPLAQALVEASDRAGIEVALCLCRASDAWGVYGCDDPDCCDIGPRPLGDRSARDAAPPRPVDEAQVDRASPARVAAFAAADERHWQLHDGEEDLDRLRRGWITALAPASFTSGPSDAQLAQMLCMLRGQHTSELLLVTIAFGDQEQLLSLAQVWGSLMGDDDEQPLPSFSRKRVRRAVAVFRELLAMVDPDDEPGLLSAISWLEWASGRSSSAAAFARRALLSSASDPVASSVAWLVERNVLPPWLLFVEEWLDESETAAAVGREG